MLGGKLTSELISILKICHDIVYSLLNYATVTVLTFNIYTHEVAHTLLVCFVLCEYLGFLCVYIHLVDLQEIVLTLLNPFLKKFILSFFAGLDLQIVLIFQLSDSVENPKVKSNSQRLVY